MIPYRRHLKTCQHRSKGTAWTRCECPVWVYAGRVDGKPIRYSLGTCDWDEALAIIANGIARPPSGGVLLADAIRLYMDDCRSRNLAAGTLVDYAAILGLLDAARPGLVLADVLPADIVRLRASRPVANSTGRKELTALRSFFHFCIRQRWIERNPASDVRMPEMDMLPTMPFSQDEVSRLLIACEEIGNQGWQRLRAKALVLLLLYSGLRIGDAVRIRRDAIDWKARRLTLRTEKTGVRVTVRLTAEVIAALDQLPKAEFLFWRGGAGHTPESSARVTLQRIGKLAEVANVHPHRFRDTFSCALLEKGADIRTVQHLLGHSSLRTTERHYAPWVAAHQRLLDAATDLLDFGSPADTVVPIRKHGGGDA